MAAKDNSYKDSISKEHLEKEELKAKIEKLNKEMDILDFQLSKKSRNQETIKSYASLGSIITGFLTLITIGFSVYQFNANSKLTLESKKEDRLSNALLNIGDTSVRKRLVGVIALRSFIKEGDSLKNSQALLSLTHSLSLENDPIIRNAILEIFHSEEIKKVDTIVLKNVLKSLINLNKEIFQREKKGLSTYMKSEIEPKLVALEAKERSLSSAAIDLLRQNIHQNDLSNMYLASADFAKISLVEIDFSNSNLSFSNFSNSTCYHCNFDKTNIMQTSFAHANLRKSSFVYKGDKLQANFITSYASSSRDFDVFNLEGADFSFSDLRNSDFHNEPLLGYSIDSSQVFLTTSFQGANIENADFSNIVIIGQSRGEKNAFVFKAGPFKSVITGTSINYQTFNALTTWALNENSKLSNSNHNYDSILRSLSDSFAGSNWKSAKFSIGIKEWFKIKPPDDKVLDLDE